MSAFLKKAILRLFPELSGGLHLDRYARVTAIADSPDAGASSERFRPRLAVDIQILDPDMEPDPAFPLYTAVPLPVPMGAGGEAGIFAPPRPGALVVVGFAYGRPDHPIIRQIYGLGDSLPQVGAGEMLLQQNPAVYQRADEGGNWTRETDAAITDRSVSRRVQAMDSVTELASEAKYITEHQLVEVDGTSTLEVGTQFTLLAGARADIGTLGALNLTAGADSTHSTGKNAVETVGADHISRVTGNRDISIGGGRDEEVGGNQALTIGGDCDLDVGGDCSANVGGNSTETATGAKSISAAIIRLSTGSTISLTSTMGGSTSVFGQMLGALGDIKDALDVLAGHTHANTGAMTEGAAVGASANSLGSRNSALGKITE